MNMRQMLEELSSRGHEVEIKIIRFLLEPILYKFVWL